MSCRASKVATTTSKAVQQLWITDQVLHDAFHRFVQVSRTHRRFGGHIPGPLEARRRSSKRRHAGTAVVSGGAPPPVDFGALFGLKPGEVSRPDFEGGWKWEAPAFGAPPPPKPSRRDNGDWRPWMRPADTSTWDGQQLVKEEVAVEVDLTQSGREEFERLVCAPPNETAIQTILEFLQGSENEPDDRLTLRFVEWLPRRALSSECSGKIAALIAQKITLGTISRSEESAVFMALLTRRDAKIVVPRILDALSESFLPLVCGRITAAILSSSTEAKKTIKAAWLPCLDASVFSARQPQSSSETWAAVYMQLSTSFRIVDLCNHFRSLDQKQVAMILLQHWVPKLTSSSRAPHNQDVSTLPQEIEWQTNNLSQKEFYVNGPGQAPNNPLVDLVATIASHPLSTEKLLKQIVAYWQKTEDPQRIVDFIGQLHINKPQITIPPSAAASLIQKFRKDDAVFAAWNLFAMVKKAPGVLASQFQDLIRHLIETANAPRLIWSIIDRWAEEDGVSIAEKQKRKHPLHPRLVAFVTEMAYSWSKTTHLRPRIAYRRVWECFRFLAAFDAPLDRTISKAFVRAGIINFVKAHQPLPKPRVQFVLDIVRIIEGEDVSSRLDALIYRYWRINLSATVYKPTKQKAQESFQGLRLSRKGELTFLPWTPRVKRHQPAWQEELDLFKSGLAIEPDAGVLQKKSMDEDIIRAESELAKSEEANTIPAAASNVQHTATALSDNGILGTESEIAEPEKINTAEAPSSSDDIFRSETELAEPDNVILTDTAASIDHLPEIESRQGRLAAVNAAEVVVSAEAINPTKAPAGETNIAEAAVSAEAINPTEASTEETNIAEAASPSEELDTVEKAASDLERPGLAAELEELVQEIILVETAFPTQNSAISREVGYDHCSPYSFSAEGETSKSELAVYKPLSPESESLDSESESLQSDYDLEGMKRELSLAAWELSSSRQGTHEAADTGGVYTVIEVQRQHELFQMRKIFPRRHQARSGVEVSSTGETDTFGENQWPGRPEDSLGLPVQIFTDIDTIDSRLEVDIEWSRVDPRFDTPYAALEVPRWIHTDPDTFGKPMHPDVSLRATRRRQFCSRNKTTISEAKALEADDSQFEPKSWFWLRLNLDAAKVGDGEFIRQQLVPPTNHHRVSLPGSTYGVEELMDTDWARSEPSSQDKAPAVTIEKYLASAEIKPALVRKYVIP